LNHGPHKQLGGGGGTKHSGQNLLYGDARVAVVFQGLSV
jgi:hypothetical protein